jgi:hypothetical protein
VKEVTEISRREFSRLAVAGAVAAGGFACGAGEAQDRAAKGGRAMLSAADLEKRLQDWWGMPGLGWPGEHVWDEEVKAVNAMMPDVRELPEWAVQVRDAMPKWGFEMCAHRWLDGLDDVIRMIGAEERFPSGAGHCGDIPGRVANAGEQRAAAVGHWLEGATPRDDLEAEVAKWLGEATPQKKEAASCFVELVSAMTDETKMPPNRWEERAKWWRGRAEQNEILQFVFEGDGLSGLLENRCGYKFIDQMDVYIQGIGGDRLREADRHGVCLGSLRYVFRDEPARFDVTRGYVWGLHAYLLGRDAGWLRANKPDCAGAAIHALRGVSGAGEPTPLRRWLVASLLKCTKLWCQHFLSIVGEEAPAYARDLPDVRAAVRGSG